MLDFTIPANVNGWAVQGTGDLEFLEQNPDTFVASKGNHKLTLRREVMVDPLTISSPPADDIRKERQFPGLVEWRLKFNTYDVARGRALNHILLKAIRFMESFNG